MNLRIATRALVLLSLAGCLSGCNNQYKVVGTVKLTGKVTKGGEPLQVDGREMGLGMVTIGFCLIEDQDDPFRVRTAAAQVDQDGNFEVVDGLEPGLYVITVEQWDPYPSTDRLQGKFNEQNSKIIREITADSELIIDVANPTG
jgi:hypothetical protein